MNPILLSFIIIICYVTVLTIIETNWADRQKKEIIEEYEEKISKIGGLSLSKDIYIEELEDQIKQLRFNHKACESCRAEMVEVTTNYRNDIKTLSSKINLRDPKTGRFTKKVKP